MPSKSHHVGEQPTTQNQSNAMSDDPRDGDRLTNNPEQIKKTPAEKPSRGDAQEQPTPEEFGARGMGVAAKE